MMLTPDDQIEAQLQSLPQPVEAPPPSRFVHDGLDRLGAAMVTASDAEVQRGQSDLAAISDAAREVEQPHFWRNDIAPNFNAAFSRALSIDNTGSTDFELQRAYGPVIEAINQGRGELDRVPNPYHFTPLSVFDDATQVLRGQPLTQRGIKDLIWSRVSELQKSNPGLAGNIPKNEAELEADVLAGQRADVEWAATLSRKSGPLGNLAQFAGGMVGGFADPINLAGSAIGFPETGAVRAGGAQLLRTFLREGAINGALDLAQLPGRMSRYEAIGEPYTPEQAVEEVAGSALIGGAIPTGIKAVHHIATLDRQPLVDAFDAAVPNPSPTARAARLFVEDDAHRANQNPYSGDGQGEDLHRVSLLEAMRAGDAGRLDLGPQRDPGTRGQDPAWQAEQHRSGSAIQSFRTSDLKTDAAAYQYKGGGDAAGVTGRLTGTAQWDPAAAGVLLIHRRADGVSYIANGHQRFGLANTLEANGHPPIELYGRVLDERDGYSVQDARVMGALVNIAEGSGTAIDAARILREAPERTASLPPRDPFVRRAQGLSRLSNDAWGMAVNGIASERDAEIVGRLVVKPEMQAPILGALAKDSPDTAREAELFVRQALAAGQTTETQSELFGDFLKSNLILPERVKILDAAMTRLRRDRALFNTLTKRESDIQAAGNVLSAAENARRRAEADRAIATITALAERKGPISDALQQAAEQSLRTGNRRAAIAHFLDDAGKTDLAGEMGRAPSGGGDGGEGIGGLEPDAEAPAISARPRAPDPEQLKAFDQPSEKPEAFHQQSLDIARELAGVEPGADALPERIPVYPDDAALFTYEPKEDLTGNNFPEDLSLRASRLYRDTSFDNAMYLFPYAGSYKDVGELFLTDNPELALGQHGNTGVLFQFEPNGIRGKADYSKPGLEFAKGKEFVTRHTTQRQLVENVVAFRIARDAKVSHVMLQRFRRLVEPNLIKHGWRKTETPDYVQWIRPRELAGVEPATDKKTKSVPPQESAKPEFGAAQAEIDALRALDQKTAIAEQPQLGLFGEGHSVKSATSEIERQARAVERLRGCIEGEG